MLNLSPTIPLIWEEPSQEENIDTLIEFLEENKSYQNPTLYKIVEYFPIGKPESYTPKIYNLINLVMGKEDGIVFSESLTRKFPNLSLVLSGFCVEDVIYIGFQTHDRKITISFGDGYIQIYY